MSAPLRPSLLPQCTSCARRLANAGLRPASSPLRHHQARSASAASKASKARNVPNALPVRLRQDIKAFGRKGAVVPVPHGLMRNKWFGAKMADYLTAAEIRELKANDVPIERDYFFGMERPEEKEEGPEVLEIPKPKAIEVEGISAQRSMELIDIFVPPRIDYLREIKDDPQQKPEANRPQFRGSSAADVLAAASAVPKETAPARIRFHGSVSTADVAAFVKEQLSVNEEASRVVVSESDVEFLAGTEPGDKTRIRYLGEYEVEIKLKNALGGVRRKLRIAAAQGDSA